MNQLPMSRKPRRDRASSAMQPATGSHSMTRATQKCSRKRVEHLV